MSEQYRPVSEYFRDCPTDAQLRKLVLAALADDRVSEALKSFVCTYHTVPLATVLSAVFRQWDHLDRRAKTDAMVEMCGWCIEWMETDSLVDNVAAWETPWDDFHDRKDGAE